MNKVILTGRLTADPDIRSTTDGKIVARYRLAVPRRYKKDGEQQADFISCITFGKSADFAERYLKKGVKICVSGRIETGYYTNKDGKTVYTTEVVVEEHEFCEKKNSPSGSEEADTSFDDVTPDDDLPF